MRINGYLGLARPEFQVLAVYGGVAYVRSVVEA